ncbi:uncharacterized protein (DUF2147 family) [Kushneria sinocarnis]|uniref:Uncharacterized protein (DUF2147 family) n=1 Tax=Kushneria sinocarnis TaxID=595502 RepID=A0A420WUC7_9GAMM|nr:DUF2147 domain-containing protein [Kushneria sinocarnis]RKQ97032.1 uncharacterized protein (DUF2147 family) [Kushneria sinocarnis]
MSRLHPVIRPRFRLLAATLLPLLAMASPAAPAADAASSHAREITGFWEVDTSHGKPEALVRIDGYQGHYTGTVVRLLGPDAEPDRRCQACEGARHNQPIVGMEIIWNLEDGEQPGHYRNGRILDPDSGKVYDFKASVSRDGQRLKGRGYIGVSMLGKTRTWQRREASALSDGSDKEKQATGD